MKHQINFAEIEIKDLDGTQYEVADLAKTLGNAVFKAADTIELNDLAIGLHKGKTVLASEQELQEIITIVSAFTYYKPWIKKQINQYLTDQLNTKQNENSKKNS